MSSFPHAFRLPTPRAASRYRDPFIKGVRSYGRSVRSARLGEDILQVARYRLLAEDQFFRDLPVASAPSD